VSGFECHADHGCITCGDEAVPLRVLAVDEARGLALCADAQDRHTSVEIALVAPVAPGDALLVHAGTAIARAPEGAAA
jgi:hydrogenase expression/formation protein HypC